MDFVIVVMMGVAFCLHWFFSNKVSQDERKRAVEATRNDLLKQIDLLEKKNIKANFELKTALKYPHLLPPWNGDD